MTAIIARIYIEDADPQDENLVTLWACPGEGSPTYRIAELVKERDQLLRTKKFLSDRVVELEKQLNESRMISDRVSDRSGNPAAQSARNCNEERDGVITGTPKPQE